MEGQGDSLADLGAQGGSFLGLWGSFGASWGSFWEPLGVILGAFGGPLGALGRSWVVFLKGRLSDPKRAFSAAPFLEPKGPKWRQKGPNGNLWARLGSLEMAIWAFLPPQNGARKKK